MDKTNKEILHHMASREQEDIKHTTKS